ncbi:glycine betaine ABC transporter substrate-binding protein [Umezawaea beigongshangensis]|uniref:glycine betaine ABC transporter substrate-binding protein n=1 Tax=Umezawaea beigongshangensis TaxID=2780383 RepID=UPI0018F244DC|nr:ABC transporter substrate-binding protein [Umezawaea beigongshangensis]
MKRTLAVVVSAAALLLSACGSSDSLGGGEDSGSGGGQIVVGSADFSENKILAEIYAGALRNAGLDATTKQNIGAREVVVTALQDGSLGVVPEYSGNLLTFFDKANELTTSEEVYAALGEKTPDGLTVLDKAEAEDKDVLVVTRETAATGIASIEDLAPRCGEFVIGAAGEWETRWKDELAELYGCTFKEFKATDAGGPITVDALKNGESQVANLFTTSADIAANDFVQLADPKNMYPAQNVVPLVRDAAVNDRGRAALNEVSAALTTENLAELVKRVDVDKETPADVAANFLQQNGI